MGSLVQECLKVFWPMKQQKGFISQNVPTTWDPVGRGDPVTALPHNQFAVCKRCQSICLCDARGTVVSICIFLSEEMQAYSELGTCLKPHADGADSSQWGQTGCGILHVGWDVEYSRGLDMEYSRGLSHFIASLWVKHSGVSILWVR